VAWIIIHKPHILIYMIWHKRLCNERQHMACKFKSWTLRYFLSMAMSCMFSFSFSGGGWKNSKSLPELPFFREIKKLEYSEKSVWMAQCQCEGRNSRTYVCFVLSYQTYQIHMSVHLVGSVAFINKVEGMPCTKAKLRGGFPKLTDCNVMMASENERVCLLWIPVGNGYHSR
jgi:hypothetical protein